jgi:hypothetical protein
MGKGLALGGIIDDADLRPAADLGQRVGQIGRAEADILLAPHIVEGQEVPVRLAGTVGVAVTSVSSRGSPPLPSPLSISIAQAMAASSRRASLAANQRWLRI